MIIAFIICLLIHSFLPSLDQKIMFILISIAAIFVTSLRALKLQNPILLTIDYDRTWESYDNSQKAEIYQAKIKQCQDEIKNIYNKYVAFPDLIYIMAMFNDILEEEKKAQDY